MTSDICGPIVLDEADEAEIARRIALDPIDMADIRSDVGKCILGQQYLDALQTLGVDDKDYRRKAEVQIAMDFRG